MNRLEQFREYTLNSGYAFMTSSLLHTAVELGLFEAIREETKSAATLAQETKTEPRALELLLNALVSLNFVQKTGNGFQMGKSAREIFLRNSENYVGDALMLQKTTYRSFGELAEVIRTGKPLGGCSEGFQAMDVPAMRSFTNAMNNFSLKRAKILARNIDLSKAKTLIDIGCGSGVFSFYFLRQNPELQATLFDLPNTLEVAKEWMSRDGVISRVNYHAGSFEKDLPGNYDTALLSHVVHMLDEEGVKNLFRKIFAILNPGGTLMVHDFFLNADKVSPQFPALFSLNMLLYTQGRSYSFQETSEWLRGAGFRDVARPIGKIPPTVGVLIATK